MKDHQTNDTFLRRILFANATFSALTGLAAMFASEGVTSFLFAKDFTVLGFAAATIVFELGVGLQIFAVLVFLVARQKTLPLGWVKAIIVADLFWVVDSVFLLVVYPEYFSSMGFEAVLIVAIVVFVFAVDQSVGIAMTYQGRSRVEISQGGNGTVITASLNTAASASRAWQVMSDQEAYADVADNLSKARVVEGDGEGMIRQCWDLKGRSWTETCTLWVEGRVFAFRVHTEAADYPYPIAALAGEWSVSPTVSGSEIKMIFTVETKAGLLNRLLFKVMAAQFAKVCNRLLIKWVEVMEGQRGVEIGEASAETLRAVPSN